MYHLEVKAAARGQSTGKEPVVTNTSARNKDQKLVGRFLKIGYFIGCYIAVPLKMYGKYGRSK